MLALSPPAQFSNKNIGCWPLEEAIGQNEDQNYLYKGINSATLGSTFHDFPDLPPSDHLNNNNNNQYWAKAEIDCSDLNMAVKKLNHNASERDRRKKINNMYSSLRALLPLSDHSKKLSIPATLSRVLKYIPEIQQEVEGLVQKRDELLSRINSTQQINLNNNNNNNDNSNKTTTKDSCQSSTLFRVSANQLNEKEVSVQISTHKVQLISSSLSQILQTLEHAGLSLLNASTFESLGGRLFHSLHLQVEESYSVECGKLGEKLKSLCDYKELLL